MAMWHVSTYIYLLFRYFNGLHKMNKIDSKIRFWYQIVSSGLHLQAKCNRGEFKFYWRKTCDKIHFFQICFYILKLPKNTYKHFLRKKSTTKSIFCSSTFENLLNERSWGRNSQPNEKSLQLDEAIQIHHLLCDSHSHQNVKKRSKKNDKIRCA